jgi:hypothetical protein
MGTFNGVNTMYTPVADQGDFCEYLQAVRLKQQGEMQRRWGYQTTGIPKQNAILNIAGGYPTGGPFVIFNQTGGALAGFSTPNLPVRPRGFRPPLIVEPVCALFSFSESGTTGDTKIFNLPANACAGTLSVSGDELGGGGSGSGSGSGGGGENYGYNFSATADGVPILDSGCLINAGAFATIPYNALVVTVIVTGGCAGAGPVGNWTIDVTSP